MGGGGVGVKSKDFLRVGKQKNHEKNKQQQQKRKQILKKWTIKKKIMIKREKKKTNNINETSIFSVSMWLSILSAQINAGCLPKAYLHNCQCLLSS